MKNELISFVTTPPKRADVRYDRLLPAAGAFPLSVGLTLFYASSEDREEAVAAMDRVRRLVEAGVRQDVRLSFESLPAEPAARP